MRMVGPVKIISAEVSAEVLLPLATFETPLWPSVHRGARVCTQAGGIKSTIIDERMTRSVILEANSVNDVQQAYLDLVNQKEQLQALISANSRFTQLININGQIIGRLLYLRFEFLTGDAAGHNMATLASDSMMTWILQRYPALNYISFPHYCSDKKFPQ